MIIRHNAGFNFAKKSGRILLTQPKFLLALNVYQGCHAGGRLASHQLDKKTELEVIATNAKEGITKTLALKRKEDTVYQAETVLMFTTMAKSKY